MKLNQTSFDDAIYGAEKEMTFQIDDSNPIIFDILRDKMYSDKIGSICREVISNCRDANREAGRGNVAVEIEIVDPNEVLFVSDLSISFNDRGLGITPNRMADVFVKYAASTKRDTNSQTGGFGLGAKTPFAYTDTFTVITVCKWEDQIVEYIYTAMIDSSRKGKMVLFDSYPVDKPTGTRVIIPIKEQDRFEFESKSIKATFLWGNLIKYINFNENPSPLQTIIDTDTFAIHKDEDRILSSLSDGYVLAIDGVPYPVNRGQLDITDRALGYGHILEIKAQVGQLSISANREAIQYDQTALDLIINGRNEVIELLNTQIHKYIKRAPSFIEACFRRLSLVDSKNNYEIDSTDPIDSLISKMASDSDNTLVSRAFNSISSKKGNYYKCCEIISSINPKHHTFTYVSFDPYKELWNYQSAPNKLTEDHLRTIYLMDSRKDARRNDTIKSELQRNKFLTITPSYDIKNPTKEQSEELMKLTYIYQLDIQLYSEVEKMEGQNRPSSRYIKKDQLILDAKSIDVSKYGSMSIGNDSIKYDRTSDTNNLTEHHVIIRVTSLQSNKMRYEISNELLHRISIIKFCNPQIKVLFVNQLTAERYLCKCNFNKINELYDTYIVTHKHKLEEVNLFQKIVDRIDKYDSGYSKVAKLNQFLVQEFSNLLCKSLTNLFDKYPQLKTGELPEVDIFWNGYKCESKFDLNNAIIKSTKKIDDQYPLLMTYLRNSSEKHPITKRKAQQYIELVDKSVV